MFWMSLICSCVLLLIANRAVRRSPTPVSCIIGSALLLMLCLFFIQLILPAVALQALLLIVGALAWQVLRLRAAQFAPISCGATLVAYGIVGCFVFDQVAQLRAQYPYVSMEDRLAPPKQTAPAQPLSASTTAHVVWLEALTDVADSSDYRVRLRPAHLEQLHEHTVQVFVKQSGFGVGRMTRPSQWTYRQRDVPAILQPGRRMPLIWSGDDLEHQSPRWSGQQMAQTWDMHRHSILDFVNRDGFGFFKDRRHVAGFQAHRFSQPPGPIDCWTLQTLDLIGLVLHEEPVAYVSDNLPRMEELAQARRRPLDDFEAVGLCALRNGEELFVRDATDCRRLLGAIRNVKQCIGCHGGERGDLLGAFSYTLTRSP